MVVVGLIQPAEDMVDMRDYAGKTPVGVSHAAPPHIAQQSASG